MLKEKIMYKVRVTFWNEVFYENSPEEEIIMSEQAYDELIKRIVGYYDNEDGSIYYTADNKVSFEIIEIIW